MRQNFSEFFRQENYPEMPETFHNALVEVIDRNMGNVSGCSKKKRIRKWLLLPAAVLTGTTVFAVWKPQMFTKLGWEAWTEEIEKFVDTEIAVTVEERKPRQLYVEENAEYVPELLELPEESALLEIRETLFDGAKLIIYGEVTEAGKDYTLGSDRIFINGEEYGPLETGWDTEHPEEYLFEIDLVDLHLTEAFEVILPMSVYEKTEREVYSFGEPESYEIPVRYENQELRFTVEVSDAAEVVPVSNKWFEQDGMTLEVQNIERSAASIKIDFYYHISDAFMQEIKAGRKAVTDPVLVLADGRAVSAYGSFSIKGPEEGISDGYYISCEYRGIPDEETEVIIQTRIMNPDPSDGQNRYEIYAEDTLSLGR